MKNLLFLLSLVLVVGTSCKEDKKELGEGMLKVSTELYNGNERVSIDDTVALTDEYNFYLSLFRLYLAQVEIKGNEGTKLISAIELVDPAGNNNSFSAKIAEGDYDTFELGYGVDAIQNDMDPGSFDNAHPLSSYQSMYWSMLKYRFAKFEGKAKSRTSGVDNIFIAYHPGTDDLYEKKSYPLNVKIRNGVTTEIKLRMDINAFMDGPGGKIDMATEPQTHSEPSDIHIARKFMENVAASAKVSVVGQ